MRDRRKLFLATPDNSGSGGTSEFLHTIDTVDYPIFDNDNVRITVSCYVYAGAHFGPRDTIYVRVRSGGTATGTDGTIVHDEPVTADDMAIDYVYYEGPIRFSFILAKPATADFLKLSALGSDSLSNAGQVAECVIESIVVTVEEAA